jgi:enoyl-CoA hydratase/carnithine racemase
MAYKDLLYAAEGHVAVITLNRPETMNSLTMETHDEIAKAIQQADDDKDVRVIVITGAGKGFCSGDDVNQVFLGGEEKDWHGRGTAFGHLLGKHLPSGARSLLKISKPSIAAVNGAAVGYGCDIALMCNMRIASERARFGEVFVRVGLMPDESLLILPRLVGLGKAYELLLSAEVIDAREAERIGLVNKVVPHEKLMDAAMELANKIAKMAPLAVQLTVEGVRRGLNWDLEEFSQYHARALSFCTETEDHREGSRAFVEKRQPEFRGQ